jgi:hypothetical protein
MPTAIHIAAVTPFQLNARKRQAKTTWCNLCKRVPPKSFVRSQSPKAEASNNQNPQGLRRPRFSFFFSTCQTARTKKAQPQIKGEIAPLQRRLLATDDYRLLKHSSKRGASEAQKSAGTRWPRQCRAQWVFYKPAPSGLSTPIVSKMSQSPPGTSEAEKS